MDDRRGHLTRPHTADVVIEAWAPSADGCYAEAVAALVSLFAETEANRTGGPPGERTTFSLGPGTAAELLVLLLEEVLLHLDSTGAVPVETVIEKASDRMLKGHFRLVPGGSLPSAGAAPKGVSYEGLSFSETAGTWRCRAVIDI